MGSGNHDRDVEKLVRLVLDLGKVYGYNLVIDKNEVASYLKNDEHSSDVKTLKKEIEKLEGAVEKATRARALKEKGNSLNESLKAAVYSSKNIVPDTAFELLYAPIQAGNYLSEKGYSLVGLGTGAVMICGYVAGLAAGLHSFVPELSFYPSMVSAAMVYTVGLITTASVKIGVDTLTGHGQYDKICTAFAAWRSERLQKKQDQVSSRCSSLLKKLAKKIKGRDVQREGCALTLRMVFPKRSYDY